MSASVKGFRDSQSGSGALFEDVYLIDGKRTPFGKYTGGLSSMSPTDLGILAGRAAIEAAGVPAAEIDQTIVANIGQASADCFFLPRHIALYSGAPQQSTALLTQRICGSGMELLGQAAEQIALGKAQLVLGCGTDTMSRFPLASYSARQGFPLGRPEFVDLLWEALNDTAAVPMGCTADNLAREYNLSREEVDAFAMRSQERYAAAQQNGFFEGEIAPIAPKGVLEMGDYNPRKYRLNSREAVAADEHPRRTTMEQLAKLPFVFSKEGPTTAGSASGIVDGAAAMMVASGDYVRAHGLKPLGKIRGFAASGVRPDIMGIGPAPSIRLLLKQLGMQLGNIDRFEINEAFSAQCLAVARELQLDEDKLNINGGAIAIGHPLGATGVRLTLTCLKTLHRDGKQFGIASACIGGGQGIALAVEAC
ncbi:acetyl-CoA C-acyltransferase [Geothermobacter hydrogeniphilus]|uniref:Acetyl-CoA C-acyltransferase n=1 Tax=Geothermobacter hydrogeniphilus TaxID=1969733 RepID=A0A2K2H6U8_9BACT|nr:thiolase family protein [Geothermobacter hydrogeniphilus]PNU19034.1 acetyl-CoA C-acyltransferase [Geothermobacter hydrogeniphilus]